MREYGWGLAAGIGVALLAFLIMIFVRKARGLPCADKFDERQMAARYKAFKSGFYTLMLCVVADACLYMVGVKWCEQPLGEFAAVFAAVTVFAVQSVRNDAFFGVERRSRSLILLYAAIFVIQTLNTVLSIRRGRLVSDGKLTLEALSLFCAATFLIVLIAIALKNREQESGEED